ncbi:tRNA (adenosine(37)-N6)-threonylcarbamoyltransferase complex dimerization subunit type 1 TsaB [Buchnera aphidicola (Formosaphis micheliae)]|uniref:tRNA (adenosine(37)-N6)-threonylcarbamoyltransferase complex dimerization subunit type 1 TsaB n=1 Tax=Buchnera aphidicola TaxID=9 RepID=UPI0031CCD43F
MSNNTIYKTILAVDTSMDGCSVSLLHKNIIINTLKICKKNHSDNILPMINKILNLAKIHIKQLYSISFCKGPGYYTSIRIAFCIVKSLSLKYNLPIIGFSTFICLAEQAWRKYTATKILIAINATKKNIYWAQYIRTKDNIWTGQITESRIKINDIHKKIEDISDKWTLVGNTWNANLFKKNKKLTITGITTPNARDIISLSESVCVSNQNLSNYNESIIYLDEYT